MHAAIHRSCRHPHDDYFIPAARYSESTETVPRQGKLGPLPLSRVHSSSPSGRPKMGSGRTRTTVSKFPCTPSPLNELWMKLTPTGTGPARFGRTYEMLRRKCQPNTGDWLSRKYSATAPPARGTISSKLPGVPQLPWISTGAPVTLSMAWPSAIKGNGPFHLLVLLSRNQKSRLSDWVAMAGATRTIASKLPCTPSPLKLLWMKVTLRGVGPN